ncbi:uncharacterized protein LOC106156673 [Lingula anatina]|uniref:Uncharacterized protein LOC106156673 n=1 Tax=Lingula anatina TaxID=7574 RepID=A0A1S3HN63_LINAN|nr:uncharacterized protein LOC106156673 [Lingula anatina]|eukprot:XP_013387500.1 uncharacterized protein LOC106156673 [Lingula anatina]
MGIGVRNYSNWIKFALFLIVLCFVLHLVSFGTPNWSEKGWWDADTLDRYFTYGLWQTCYDGSYSDCYYLREPSDWHYNARALEVVGLIGVIICIVICATYIATPRLGRNAHLVLITLIVFCLLTSIFILSGVILWWANTPNVKAGYSAIFAFLAGISMMFCGFAVFMETRFLEEEAESAHIQQQMIQRY